MATMKNFQLATAAPVAVPEVDAGGTGCAIRPERRNHGADFSRHDDTSFNRNVNASVDRSGAVVRGSAFGFGLDEGDGGTEGRDAHGGMDAGCPFNDTGTVSKGDTDAALDWRPFKEPSIGAPESTRHGRGVDFGDPVTNIHGDRVDWIPRPNLDEVAIDNAVAVRSNTATAKCGMATGSRTGISYDVEEFAFQLSPSTSRGLSAG